MSDNFCPFCNRPMATDPGFQIVVSRGVVLIDGKTLTLPRRLMGVLAVLARGSPRVVSKDALFDAVPRPATATFKNLDVDICQIRRALKGTRLEGAIKTFWGDGYALAISKRAEFIEIDVYDGEEADGDLT